jgi:ectoine hydroxylase-related dioxygenase (phytanoyl-CoA dioxygenase family)
MIMLTETMISCQSAAQAELAEKGFTIVRGALPATDIAALERDLAPRFDATPFCEGGFYGERTKRFGRLLLRSPRAADLVMHPAILAMAEAVLLPWCERIQLNLTQAIELHPGALAQYPHRDQDMWQGLTGEVEYLVNVLWPLTPFTAENGATMIWPRSHGLEALVEEPPEPAVVAEAGPGDAIVFLGSTLHGAGANRSAAVRRGIIISYSLGWLKPYENPWLAYPPYLACDFSRELAALAGYAQHRPNLGNFEGQCPSILLAGYPEEPLAAIDALRPDQAALLAEHVASQRAALDGVSAP